MSKHHSFVHKFIHSASQAYTIHTYTCIHSIICAYVCIYISALYTFYCTIEQKFNYSIESANCDSGSTARTMQTLQTIILAGTYSPPHQEVYVVHRPDVSARDQPSGQQSCIRAQHSALGRFQVAGSAANWILDAECQFHSHRHKVIL